MADDVNDFLASGGIPAFKFENLGDTIEGTVVRSQLKQQTDIETGAPLAWEDGSPKMQVIIDLQTNLRDPKIDGDDGLRRVYMRSAGLTSLRTAVRVSGGPLDVGGYIKITHNDLGEKQKGKAQAKLFNVQYKPPTGQALSADDIA